MTVEQLRVWGRNALVDLTRLSPPSTIPAETIALEVDVLLSAATGMDSARLLTARGETVAEEPLHRFRSFVTRRVAGEPIAYILGTREFYGRDFVVTSDVLIPRPETELLVDRALHVIESIAGPFHFVDIGTGSGAIAISVVAELEARGARFVSKSTFSATDISASALAIATLNQKRLLRTEPIAFSQSDLLSCLTPSTALPWVIVSNPPYVPDGEKLPLTVEAFEPRLALRGGPKGLDIIRRLLSDVKPFLIPGGAFLFEIGDGQSADIESALINLGYSSYSFQRDLGDIPRVVEIRG